MTLICVVWGKDLHELETTINSELARVQEWLALKQLTLKIKKNNNKISLFLNPTKKND